MITAEKARELKLNYEAALRNSEDYVDVMKNIETIVTERASEGYDFANVDEVDRDMRQIIVDDLRKNGFEVSMNGRFMMVMW